MDRAVDRFADVMQGWRVLAAHRDGEGLLQPIAPDWAALEKSVRPVILVVRLDGSAALSDPERLRREILDLYRRWSGELPHLAGVEIDHDSPTAKLSFYAHFLADLRRDLPRQARLSVTALPAWLDAPALRDVLAETDESVLQLHAVMAPQAGIFKRSDALSWVRHFARLTPKPFRIALPAYGIRLGRKSDGTVLSVESEVPLLAGGSTAEEIRVPPEEIALLLRSLTRDRPDRLIGVNWFRLPVAGDRRAWSAATLRAVIAGAPLDDKLVMTAEPGAVSGLFLIEAANEGGTDIALPRQVGLPEACREADGSNGYSIRVAEGRPWLDRQQNYTLHEGQRVQIGWARCPSAPEDFDVRK